MVFWAVIVFLLGLVGILHECCMIGIGVPIFGEAISVIMMLISLGMLYTIHRDKKKQDKK